MSAPTRLAAFAVAAAAVFGAGWGIGEAVGPLADAPAEDAPAEHGDHAEEQQ